MRAFRLLTAATLIASTVAVHAQNRAYLIELDSRSDTFLSGVSTAGSLAVGTFADGGTIPTEYTCAGAGRRPDLHWSAPPAGTKELAVLVFDPDAPGGGFVHDLRWGMDPSRRSDR